MDFREKKVQEEEKELEKEMESESSPFFEDAEADDVMEDETSVLKKKVKNLTSLLFILIGLFVGSLYVDVSQLITKSGFSSKALSKTDIVTAAGKTWVAYDQPIVHVSVITDEKCEKCQPDEALVWLRRIMPTVSAEIVDVNDGDRAKRLIKSADITSIPAFVFSKEVADLPVFAQAEQLFKKLDKKDEFLLDTAQIGIPVGKYLELPSVGDDDVKIGSENAPVRVVEFTDFQCPYCKAFHETLQKELKTYGDKVLYIYKSFPLPFHAQAEGAALAGECANEQGKFVEYSDNLFSKQDEWGKTSDTKKFKEYAVAFKLDTKKFNECLDTKKYQEKINANKEEGQKFGVSGTPGTFINGVFLNGAVSADELKTAIDAEVKSVSENSKEEKK